MADRDDFQEKQLAFAAHIRDPKRVRAPDGIEDRRMAVYRELFFNNLKSLLATTFPVLSRVIGDAEWRSLIRQFMIRHRAETPYFVKLPEELLRFLETEYEPESGKHPYMLELAHYEYIELALNTSTDANDTDGIDPEGDLLAEVPVKSVLAWTFAYHYPVHRISPDFLPTEPSEQPVYLAIYRNSADQTSFMELNPLTAGLLDAIDNNTGNASGETLIRNLGAAIAYPDMDALVAHGHAAMRRMLELEILTGTRPLSA
ncbi:MAG: putative DNA-binding domain-containing protein [Planctomycetes bacterium]|nr:putative DNA-binding domain-containing protein [Planctomycetota bacterium]